MLVAGLLRGMAEDLFFRGFVQTRLRERWGGRWAILWTAEQLPEGRFGDGRRRTLRALLACCQRVPGSALT
jgi:hypothetical protein